MGDQDIFWCTKQVSSRTSWVYILTNFLRIKVDLLQVFWHVFQLSLWPFWSRVRCHDDAVEPSGGPRCQQRSWELSQHVHMDRSEHGVSLNMVKILTVENKKFGRCLKEVIYIWVAKPNLNHCLLWAVWPNLLKARVQAPPRSQDCRWHRCPPLGSKMSSWSLTRLKKGHSDGWKTCQVSKLWSWENWLKYSLMILKPG